MGTQWWPLGPCSPGHGPLRSLEDPTLPSLMMPAANSWSSLFQVCCRRQQNLKK